MVKKKYLLSFSLVFSLVLLSYFAFAGDVIITMHSKTATSTNVYYVNVTTSTLYNFTIANGSRIINQTNFTFSGLTITFNTNGTTVDGAVTNSTVHFNWINDSVNSPGLINGTKYFWFGLSGAEGLHNITIRTTDFLGIVNTTEINITIDPISPDIDFIGQTETDGGYIIRSNIFINTSLNDTNLKNVTIYLYNTTKVLINSSNFTLNSINTSASVNFTGLADGIYYFNATTYDKGERQNSTAIRNVTLDTINPNIDFNSQTETDGSYISRNNTVLNISTFDINFKNVTIYLYNSAKTLTNFSSNTTINSSFINFTDLADGIYYFNATTYDKAGRQNSTAIRNVTLDTINPNIDFIGQTETDVSYIKRSNIFINTSLNDTNFKNVTIYLYNTTIVLINYSSSTISSLNTSASINFTGLADGTYYFNATTYDKAGRQNSTAIRTVTLDTTVPKATIVSPSKYSNVSFPATNGIVLLNATINDSSSGPSIKGRISYAYFDITYPNGTSIETLPAINTSAASYTNASFNVSNLTRYPDGNYLVKIWANDSVNNINNSEIFNITIDRTAPVLTLTAGETNQTYLNLTIAASDTSGLNGTCTSGIGTIAGVSSIYVSGLTCNTAYSFNVTCYDSSNNTGNITQSFTTSACDVAATTSGGGGGSTANGIYWAINLYPLESQLQTGYSKPLGTKYKVNFKLGNESHYVGVLSLTTTTATIQVSSSPQEKTMNVGDEWKVDLNSADGLSTYDLSVKLASINFSRANLVIKKINESYKATPTTPTTTTPTAGEKAKEAISDVVKSGSIWLWVGILIIIVVIVLLIVFWKKIAPLIWIKTNKNKNVSVNVKRR